MPTSKKALLLLARLTVFLALTFNMLFSTALPARTMINDEKPDHSVQSFQDSDQPPEIVESPVQPYDSSAAASGAVSVQGQAPVLRGSTPVTHACTPNALVVLATTDRSKMERIISTLESLDGCALHIFPPDAFIGFIPPVSQANILGLPGVDAIYASSVDLAALSRKPSEVQTAAYLWNHNYVNPQPAELPGPYARPLTGDHLMVEPNLLPLQPDDYQLSPGYNAVSEFMVGKVAVGIIIPESNGSIDLSTENWSPARMNNVVAEIQAAMSWWNTQNPNGNLSFVYDIHYQVPTSYEPINRPSNNDSLWVAETLTTLGYPGTNWYAQVFQYLNAIRSANHTDWAVLAYVVDSLNDWDGTFTNGYFGYTYGSLIVMTYDNDGWGIGNMDSVMAHEFAHNFGAGDEYCSPGYACCWGGGQLGYLGIPNSNCEAGCDHNFNGVCDGNDANPGSNCHDCPACVEVNCLMRNGGVENGLDLPSQQQVGIRDSDGDNILDPADTIPDLTLDEYVPDPTSDNTPTWTGYTQDIPWNSPVRTDVTINFITNVYFRMDGGTWGTCSADDGDLDETEESFSCTTPALADGSHTIEVVATNRVGNSSDIVADTLTIDTSKPPDNFSKIQPADTSGGISTATTLSWEPSSGADYYEYCIDTIPGTECDTSWISTGSATSASLSGLDPNTTHYWQVQAHNAHGDTLADAGTWWSFTTASGVVEVLLVDDDDNDPNVRSYYTDALNTLGVLFNTWDTSHTDNEPDTNQLSSYEIVIWFTGDEYGGTAGPGAVGEAALGTWLDSGKCLMLSSQDYLYDRGATTFATNYLGLGAYSNDIGDFTSVTGQGVFTGLGPYTLSYPFTEFVDILTPGTGAASAWLGDNGHTAAIYRDNGVYRTTFFGYPWEAISNSGERQTVLSRFISWCNGTPGDFTKSAPANVATGVSLTPTLSWGSSSGATSYEYCFDTTLNSVCNATWTEVGTTTSVDLAELSHATQYEWQVRAKNGFGTTYANGGTWWSFTTGNVPGTFSKAAPADGAIGVSLTPTLSWGSSSGATSYEYCYDATLNSVCNATWTDVGNTTGTDPVGLSNATQYEWQVRAKNGFGTTYANGGTWWSFTTIPLPPPDFNKLTPANPATDVSTDPTLTWQSSLGTSHYEYCYDTNLNSTCNATWTDVGTSTSADLVGLSNATQYEWQVRAVNAGGTTYANGGTWWSFTTRPLIVNYDTYIPIIVK